MKGLVQVFLSGGIFGVLLCLSYLKIEISQGWLVFYLLLGIINLIVGMYFELNE